MTRSNALRLRVLLTLEAVLRHDGSRARAAKQLGISRSQVYRHLEQNEAHALADMSEFAAKTASCNNGDSR